ncbi:MAG: hypothetical protein B7Z55_08820 [Planctomycetales bacterium 12-60-4]|nr:MAG: hypothetical protein B7Z55_08820 [Planctomycetales bacterium 12-60-4]
MSDQLKEVIVAAQGLAEPERWRLIAELLETMTEDPPIDEDDLAELLVQRAAEGLKDGVMWEELRDAE